ncbi:MAG TPA: hypothetical protein VI756_07330, partial [Blastocatellia bacterium]
NMRCLSCGEILLYGATVCRYCSAQIDQQSALQNAIVFTLLARICSLANNIRTLRPAISLIVAIDAVVYLANYNWLLLMSPTFMSFLGCAAVLRWRWRYGDLDLLDLEFRDAQKKMKRELDLWLAVVSLQVIVLILFRPG